jgi:hypothetical protein
MSTVDPPADPPTEVPAAEQSPPAEADGHAPPPPPSPEPRTLAPPKRRTLTPALWLMVLGVFAAYLPSLARGATFTDAPEITTAIHTLGVIHPTGYPIFTVLAHFFTRALVLPLPVIVKVEIFNALCGMLSALLVARCTTRLLMHVERIAPSGDRRRADLAGLFAGLMVGVGPLVWAQVRIAEVYPFQLLLVCSAAYAWTRFEVSGRNGWVVLAALPMGMGLAHHVTMVYMLPAALVYLLVRKPFFFVAWLLYPVARIVRLFRPGFMAERNFEGWWAFPVACVVGFVPMLSYYYLIWANAHTSGVTWGDVHDWPTLWDHATGKQYQGFLKLKPLSSYLDRVGKLPVVFDEQFLPAGTALFFSGIAVLFRRSWRFALLLMAYLVFNVAHGVYYAVGDYANYFIPALLSCAMFIGYGLYWLWGWAGERPERIRFWACWAAVTAMLAAAAIGIRFYQVQTKRYGDHGPFMLHFVALPLLGAAMVMTVLGLVLWLRHFQPARPVRAATLPKIFTVGLLTLLLSAAALRGHELRNKSIVGESYGREVASALPPGAVLLTQGDGFLFSMWYAHHVLGLGLDAQTLDMGNLKTPWYQRYLQGHYPAVCDPLAPAFQRDPEAYRRKCGTFRQRLDTSHPTTWGSLGLRRSGSHPEPAWAAYPVVRGAEPRCADETYRKEHIENECRCWEYAKRPEGAGEDCVYSSEEGGVVPREAADVLAHRIIEDVLAERPVYERNMFTRWLKSTEENRRQWNGPAYLRPPGQYDLLNRGRFNQVVFHADLGRFADPCAHEQVDPVRLRALRPVGSTRRREVRERYEPNDRPTLLTATYLTVEPGGTDDDATRDFQPGEPAYIHFDWFERFRYDTAKADHRGEPIREGVRLCLFDPDGRRVALTSTVSGEDHPVRLLALGTDAKLGSYRLQACSVGDVGERKAPLPDDLPCQRILLEYELRLVSGQAR